MQGAGGMAQGFVRGDVREKCSGIIIPYYPYLKLLIHLGCLFSQKDQGLDLNLLQILVDW